MLALAAGRSGGGDLGTSALSRALRLTRATEQRGRRYICLRALTPELPTEVDERELEIVRSGSGLAQRDACNRVRASNHPRHGATPQFGEQLRQGGYGREGGEGRDPRDCTPGYVGGAAVVLSQLAIVTSWGDARYGTIANILVLVGVTLGFLSRGPSSLRAEYDREVAQGIGRVVGTAS